MRDDDRITGHIPGSLNLPAHSLMYNPAHLSTLLAPLAPIPMLVFHCALSQQRGPKCARIVSQYFKEQGVAKHVRVLRGGFVEWGERYQDDRRLVKDYKPELID